MKSRTQITKNTVLQVIIISSLLSCALSCNKMRMSGDCSHNCAECKVRGEIKWCSKCYNSSHFISNSTNGRCVGENSPIEGCLVTQSIQGFQSCVECRTGYHLLHKHSSESGVTLASCLEIEDPNGLTLSLNEEGQLKLNSCKYGYQPIDNKCQKI